MGVLKNQDALMDLKEALTDTNLETQMAAAISFAALGVPGLR